MNIERLKVKIKANANANKLTIQETLSSCQDLYERT